ncbi:Flagellar hook-basal body complex protein FliE [Fervidicola ferrireducens]|uniref:Flagellar hook-basal body complex protein FliE n=1 Tax=Fervidicola ferrireducens TaxID=520764 RepID=A0A140LAN1_9FIRM|nr:flagellar hook-basal body complex protein FliE [Fervidicola ferrireducens]KXG77606.1 Flagellar hook-basal body complex protein FliE [Fervidicola ferrireducens]
MLVGRIGESTGNLYAQPTDSKSNNSFSELLKKAFETINGYQKNYDDVLRKMLAGEDVSVHEIMIAAEKAKLSLDLAIQVRNKALEAYQEIMRMQI